MQFQRIIGPKMGTAHVLFTTKPHPTIMKTKTARWQMNLIRCIGSLEDFENIRTAYRAEVEHNGLLYKLWKEDTLYPTRRLEIFHPNKLEPEVWRIFITPSDLRATLPKALVCSEKWRLFVASLD